MNPIDRHHRVKGALVLANGRIFTGFLFGAAPKPESFGEVVFNTSLTGYQEILTDPSYQGQIVVMTPSHIGNTGINLDDIESHRVFLSGFVIQELSPIVSNWRSSNNLHTYLQDAGIPGLFGIDTRALTRALRSEGAVTGLITADVKNAASLVKTVKKLPTLNGRDLVQEVSTDKPYTWTRGAHGWMKTIPFAGAPKGRGGVKKKVVVMDFGVKQNILRSLADQNCEVTVVPAKTEAEAILAFKPDGVLLSNGPGDPAAVTYAVQTVRDLAQHAAGQKKRGEKPLAIFGICLGHQLLGLALGGRTYKLKFGHHGANHPIMDLENKTVDITSQNHGFCIEAEKAKNGTWLVKGNKDVLVTHINLNDNAIEGLRHGSLPFFSVQYHPEASAGPHDASHLFDRFLKLMN